MTLYFDYAATCPVDPAVADGMARVLRDATLQANPSALHEPGLAARDCVETARVEVAALVGALPTEIVFTSGATESNNLAILGAARFAAPRGRHLVTAVTEHASVSQGFRQLEREGFAVTWLRPGTGGVVTPEALAQALRPDTTLVSLMQVNNETGLVQDVAAFGAICRARGVLLHVDAVQAAGHEPVDVQSAGIDLLSLSAHKLHGPKGIGALFLDRRHSPRVVPLHFGGGQERGLRPGTVATHQAHGFGIAARLAREALAAGEPRRIAGLRDRLWAGIRTIDGLVRNGEAGIAACHILNVSIAGVEGESLRFALRALAVSGGAACDAASDEPSPVLRELGRAPALARASLRFSFGRPTTAAEVDEAIGILREAAAHLRRIAPGD